MAMNAVASQFEPTKVYTYLQAFLLKHRSTWLALAVTDLFSFCTPAQACNQQYGCVSGMVIGGSCCCVCPLWALKSCNKWPSISLTVFCFLNSSVTASTTSDNLWSISLSWAWTESGCRCWIVRTDCSSSLAARSSSFKRRISVWVYVTRRCNGANGSKAELRLICDVAEERRVGKTNNAN